MRAITQNTLFYGDNLNILREYIPDKSVDLIYLDPPFNSNRNYNVLVCSKTKAERIRMCKKNRFTLFLHSVFMIFLCSYF